MCFFDTHMHLTKARLEDALCRMLKENKICALSVAVDFNDSVLNAQLRGENIYVGAGLHPCFSIGRLSDKEKDDWNNLLNNNKIACMGECGLDDKATISLDDQLYNLRFFCDLAAAYSLPLSVHIRKYHNELLKLLNEYNGKLSGIIHGFTFSKDLAKRYLDAGFMLGVGRYGLKRGRAFNEALAYAGILNLVLESDFDGRFDYDVKLFESLIKELSILFSLDKKECKNKLLVNSFSVLNLNGENIASAF